MSEFVKNMTLDVLLAIVRFLKIEVSNYNLSSLKQATLQVV